MKRILAILMTLIMVFGLSSVGVWADETATWVEEAEMVMPKALSNTEAVRVDDKIYVIGNQNNTINDYLFIYDLKTNTWTQGKSLPDLRMRFSVEAVGDKIYVFGGLNNSKNDVYGSTLIYDTKTGDWTTGISMDKPKHGVTTAVVGTDIYVIGGAYKISEGTFSVATTMDIYDTLSNSWTTKNKSIPGAWCDAVSEVIGDKIYVAGGTGSSKVGIYDVTTGVWTVGASLLNSAVYSAAAVVGDEIYIIGGGGSSVYDIHKKVQIYSTSDNTMRLGTELNSVRNKTSALVLDNKIYVFGGEPNTNSVISLQVVDGSVIPEAPSNLAAIGGNSVVDLSWGAASGADSYAVKRSTTPGGIYATISTTSAITYTDTDVTNGTTYYYVVTAVSEGGESASSNEASATPANVPMSYLLSVLLDIDETVQLSVTHDLSDNNALTWSSSEPSIATVDGNGKVTAIAEGLAYITARNEDGSFNEQIPVRVVKNADEMRIAIHLITGQKARLYLAETPESVAWSSLDNSVVKVTSTGEITAVGRGLAIVQGEIDGKTFQIYVRVNS
jgi:N-acetylneuraminic acid mutarotase